MKQKISLFLVLVMAIGMIAGCSSPAATTAQTTAAAAVTESSAAETTAAVKADDGVKKVAFLTPTAASGFMAFLAGEFEKAFTAGGYEWNIGIADGDSKKQIEQIENFITLGVDTMVVVAVESSSLKDVLTKAHDAGIKIINFTTDPGVGDIYDGADEGEIGDNVAQLASKWIDATFPNAAAGSVKVAVMEFRDTPEAAKRSDALQNIAKLNSKVTIVKTVQSGNTAQAAQPVAENLFLTNPDINAVLTYNSAMGLGVNAYVMSQGSAVADKSTFGVFGADQDREIVANIKASTENKSVIRGATQISADIIKAIQELVVNSDEMLEGKEVPARKLATILQIDATNVDEKIVELGYDKEEAAHQ